MSEINKIIKKVPEKPGIYIMYNKTRIIYIGKAKNLKKRVTSYFNKNIGNIKTIKLVSNITNIEWIITNNEIESLILENNLIKKHKPRYNINLKDEKTYPYICITKEKFERISIVRTTKRLNLKNYEYYGPYPQSINDFMESVISYYKIRTCNLNMDKKHHRPCIKHYINKCLAPCINKEIELEYKNNVKCVRNILNGKTEQVILYLKDEMKRASENQNYERAIEFRNKLFEANKLKIKQNVDAKLNYINEDVFAVEITDDRIFIFVLNIRNGKLVGKNSLNFFNNNELDNDINLTTLFQYYMKYPIVNSLVLDDVYLDKQNLIEKYFLKNSKKLNLFFPKISSRRKNLLKICKENLENYVEKVKNLEKSNIEILKNLKNLLGLKYVPEKIECFDISNISGKDAVGSMSVLLCGKHANEMYRRYKIKTLDTPDDFAMHEEVLTRRYSKLARENLPNLIFIDGGLGQLNVAIKVLTKLNLLNIVDVASIAKKEEIIFTINNTKGIKLSHDLKELKILQNLRDEAHRFGITYHRKLRKKRINTSFLDNIDGIGAITKKKLLNAFTKIENIKNAEVFELEKIVNKNVAQKIFDYVRENI